MHWQTSQNRKQRKLQEQKVRVIAPKVSLSSDALWPLRTISIFGVRYLRDTPPPGASVPTTRHLAPFLDQLKCIGAKKNYQDLPFNSLIPNIQEQWFNVVRHFIVTWHHFGSLYLWTEVAQERTCELLVSKLQLWTESQTDSLDLWYVIIIVIIISKPIRFVDQ